MENINPVAHVCNLKLKKNKIIKIVIIIIIKHFQIIFILFSEDMDRKRNKWSLAQMEKAVCDVRNGKKIRKAARENNVPYKTLYV